MGRHKNTDGTFVPVGLKIRFEIVNRLYQTPGRSVKIPSARELAARFHLSPSTVTLELQKLVREGYLIGKRGSGTYTNPDKVHRFVTLLTVSEENMLEELNSQNLSGLIWIHPHWDYYGIIRKLQKNGLPTVAVKCNEPDIPSIDYSFFESGCKIAKLAAEEKRRLIFYAPTNKDIWTLQRVAGIKDYIAHHPEAKMKLEIFSSVQKCTEELEKKFAAGEIPDAFYANGEYVFVMMDLAKKYRIDIVDRCRLFAEEQHIIKSGKFHGYVLRYLFQEIGEKAAEMMAELLKNPAARFPVYHTKSELIFRSRTEPL